MAIKGPQYAAEAARPEMAAGMGRPEAGIAGDRSPRNAQTWGRSDAAGSRTRALLLLP